MKLISVGVRKIFHDSLGFAYQLRHILFLSIKAWDPIDSLELLDMISKRLLPQ